VIALGFFFLFFSIARKLLSVGFYTIH